MNLHTTPAPHIRGADSAREIMRDVCLALLPALLFGIVRFGVRVLAVTAASVGAAVLGELLAHRLWFRGRQLDWSAVVTGLLLAMTLPPTVSLWTAALGGGFAVVVMKALGGGLGQNILNPALAARALLVLCVPANLTRYPVDAVSSATPLHRMAMHMLPEESLQDLFFGFCAGSIGEVSTLALLLGGAYLIWRRVITIRIPAAYLGTAALLTLVFHRGDLMWMLCSLCSGGLMLGAIFMATDYASSPITPGGQLLYGAGCGALTVLFRRFGIFPEGVTYAILWMNAAVWEIERWTMPVVFGHRTSGGAA